MIEQELPKSKAFVLQQGWDYKDSGVDQWAISPCPFCGSTNHKFYMNVSGSDKDGLYHCVKCDESGNLFSLKKQLGTAMEGVASVKDAASSHSGPAPLPNFDTLHWNLLNNELMYDALDYLSAQRKISLDIIKQYKIGAEKFDDKLWIVMPSFDAAGNAIYYKARSVPPAPKAFRSPAGREAALFNGTCLKPGMEYVIVVEGEMDALSLLSQGEKHVVGVPGANIKKAAWLEKLDRIAPKNIYLLYDSDKVGQEAARDIAAKIGIEKAKNVLLPKFEVDGRPGKDINDYFMAGHTLADLDGLLYSAQPFNVMGVQSVVEVIDDFRKELEQRGTDPKYKTQWDVLNRRVGGWEDGDLVGWMAEGKIGKTTALMNLLNWYSMECGHVCLLDCLEMKPTRMIRKWMSHVTQTDDTPGASKITTDTIDQSMAYAASMKGDLLFGYHRINKTAEAYETIRQAVRRYGVKVVCFDNLQLLVRSLEHAAQETSRITKDFKAMAMELNILIHLIIQPNRVAEGQIVAARNAMGSSAIEKDVDAMICMHRNRVAKIREADFNGFLDTDDNFEPQMLMRADLTRYAAGGCCTLWMDGALSTVREISEDECKVSVEPTGIIQPEGVVI